MTMAQLMALIEVELEQRREPRQPEPADPSEWGDWSGRG